MRVYKEIIEGKKIEEVRRKVVDEKAEWVLINGIAGEMQEKANEGYFINKSERNLIYCPGGEFWDRNVQRKTGISVIPIKIHVKLQKP